MNSHPIARTIRVGRNPFGIFLTPDNRRLYVPNSGSNTVSVIRTFDNVVIKTIPVGRTPINLWAGITPDGRFVYVNNFTSNTVSVIRTLDNKVIKTIRVGKNPMHVKISPDGKRVYVINI